MPTGASSGDPTWAERPAFRVFEAKGGSTHLVFGNSAGSGWMVPAFGLQAFPARCEFTSIAHFPRKRIFERAHFGGAQRAGAYRSLCGYQRPRSIEASAWWVWTSASIDLLSFPMAVTSRASERRAARYGACDGINARLPGRRWAPEVVSGPERDLPGFMRQSLDSVRTTCIRPARA